MFTPCWATCGAVISRQQAGNRRCRSAVATKHRGKRSLSWLTPHLSQPHPTPSFLRPQIQNISVMPNSTRPVFSKCLYLASSLLQISYSYKKAKKNHPTVKRFYSSSRAIIGPICQGDPWPERRRPNTFSQHTSKGHRDLSLPCLGRLRRIIKQ